ncbi:hypothetical protein FHX37_3359 [Haloactinospora alba]|uniref:Uncharacterized protein n=2 Tax=Haloactinospora alba TaxID=405555 RepID=A0A543NND2_9ACTN|nr:hypothetical protein FHX37_3359 [Haloactinospora alba]
MPAAFCLVAGLRFLPLARLYDQRHYRWTRLLLPLVAVAGSARVGTAAHRHTEPLAARTARSSRACCVSGVTFE